MKNSMFYLCLLVSALLFSVSCDKTGNDTRKSAIAKILKFSIVNDLVLPDPVIQGTTITFTAKVGTTPEQLKFSPTIEISPNATVVPASGIEQDFSKEVTYTVTAENGRAKTTYKVIVEIATIIEAKIIEFELPKETLVGDVEIGDDRITFNVTQKTDLTKIVPTITISKNATIEPASGVEQDFSKEVTYTVSAKDGKTSNKYTVIAKKLSNEAKIIKLSVTDEDGSEVVGEFGPRINIYDQELLENSITCKVSSNRNTWGISPSIIISEGATIRPGIGVPQNFESSQAISYTVTSEDKTNIIEYTVFVERKKSAP